MVKTKSSSKPKETSRGLTRERIAEAALRQISAHGRPTLSMRNVASELGCEAMSLYHHVDGIEGVLDAVQDRLLAEITALPRKSSDPQKQLLVHARAYLGLADAYPEAFPLVATRLWHTPIAMEAAALSLSLIRELGFKPRVALQQTRVLGAYLNGAGLALAEWHKAAGIRRGAEAAAKDPRLAALAPDMDARNVRADLDDGLVQILASIKREAGRD